MDKGYERNDSLHGEGCCRASRRADQAGAEATDERAKTERQAGKVIDYP